MLKFIMTSVVLIVLPAAAFAQSGPAVSIEEFARAVNGALKGQELRLTEVEKKAKEVGAQIASISTDLTTIKNADGAKSTEFERKLNEFTVELAKIKTSRAAAAKKRKELDDLLQKTAKLADELSARVEKLEKTTAKHAKKLGEHETRLAEHDKQLDNHRERLEHVEAVTAGNAVTVEAVIVGNKEGAGGGALIGFAFGLDSGKVAQVRAGVTNSIAGKDAYGILLTAALLFPLDEGWRIGVGGYSLTDFDKIQSKGISAKVWQAGLMLGPVYQQGVFTSSLTGGVGGSIALDGQDDSRFAFIVIGTLGVRL